MNGLRENETQNRTKCQGPPAAQLLPTQLNQEVCCDENRTILRLEQTNLDAAAMGLFFKKDSMNQNIIKQFCSCIGSSFVIREPDACEAYAQDEYPGRKFYQIPGIVLKPGSASEVAAVMRICSDNKIPVTVRGGGTGLAGACVPNPGGIVLSMERLNRLVDADSENQTITVEAGMTLSRFYREVAKTGLYFPPHPGDDGAFTGGIAATNAGGARAVKHGTVRKFIRGMEAVTAQGDILQLGGKYIKSSSGYPLMQLIIGSEGTLAVITQITFSLVPAPKAQCTLVVPFASVTEAIDSVSAILNAGQIPLAAEFVEHPVLRLAENMTGLRWPAEDGSASLMFILDGNSEDQVMDQAVKMGEILQRNGALDILVAQEKRQQADILKLRSVLYEALRPGVADMFDISLPRSEITGHITAIHQLEERLNIHLPTYGHAGDGNLHTHYMRREIKDGALSTEIPNWEILLPDVQNSLFSDVRKRGGVISGEHGIGLAKRKQLKSFMDPVQLELMKGIKKQFDPQCVLNPGKIFESASGRVFNPSPDGEV